MALSQVITFAGSPDQLVWKYPDENITTTSQLIVDATHEALLVVNGEAADLFGPGTRTLSLPNIPIVNKITQIPTGGVNPFPCKVFYVNKVHQMELLWGTMSPITLDDPEFSIFLHVSLCGSVSFSVSDARKFLLKMVGFRKEFMPESIVSNFKSIISAKVKDCISKIMINGRIGFFKMDAHLSEVSEVVMEYLNGVFEEYGLTIQFFNIESISVPEKDYDAVSHAKERRAARIIEGYSWQEEQQMGVMKAYAANEGALGTAGGIVGGMVGGAVMGGTFSELARYALDPARLPQSPPPGDVATAEQNAGNARDVRDILSGKAAAVQLQNAGPAVPPPPPVVYYHVVLNGQAAGPFDAATLGQMLAANQINASSLVWKQGMANWAKIDTVDELKYLFAPPIPPIPNLPPIPPVM